MIGLNHTGSFFGMVSLVGEVTLLRCTHIFDDVEVMLVHFSCSGFSRGGHASSFVGGGRGYYACMPYYCWR